MKLAEKYLLLSILYTLFLYTHTSASPSWVDAHITAVSHMIIQCCL